MYAPNFSYPQGSTANLWAQTKDQLVVMVDKTKPFQAADGFITQSFLLSSPAWRQQCISQSLFSLKKLHLSTSLHVSFTIVQIWVGFQNIVKSESLNHITGELNLLTFALTRKNWRKTLNWVPLHISSPTRCKHSCTIVKVGDMEIRKN